MLFKKRMVVLSVAVLAFCFILSGDIFAAWGDKELETDPDEFDEEDVEKLRKAVAKELGITLPKAKAVSKKDTKKKKK